MKLVKIKINNRIDRILNFDRHEQFHNNSYIIRNSGTGLQELFRISALPQLIDDEGMRDLTVNVTGDGNELKVTFTSLSGKSKQKENAEGLERDGNDYICKREKPADADHFKLNFQYENTTISLCIYFATSENTYDAIVDFGSEASQAVWLNGGIINHVGLTESIRDQHTENTIKNEEDLRKFVQYESDTLYKSIYHIKKQLTSEPTPACAWPKYDGGDWKFLALNSTSLGEYIQLPNSKLFRFDLGNYTDLRIKVDHERKQLRQFGDGIVERILLNNIVKQVLKEIVSNADKEKGAYITLNILMPNVYPIHMAAQKLEWLAEDIKALVNGAITSTDANTSGENSNQANEPSSDQQVSDGQSSGKVNDQPIEIKFDKIRAVELRAISESDASMIGYINSLQNNHHKIKPGNYLIMDAGKGTLDFSFMEVQTSGTPYVNRSRSGIVGAGNAVTYGLLVGLVNDYLSQEFVGYQTKTEEEKHQLIKDFIYTKILVSDIAQLTPLIKAVESYKKVYNELYKNNATHTTVTESVEAKATIQELDINEFTKWITDEDEQSGLVEANTFLSEDSCKFVTYEIENIVNEVGEKLKDMLTCTSITSDEEKEKKLTPVKGAIFTGRGFLMKELFDKMQEKLQELQIMMPNDKVITLDKESDMKGICIEINQKIITDKYDASPSHQTIGIHTNITDDDETTENTETPKKKKKNGGGDPKRNNLWGEGFGGFREYNGEYTKQRGGNVSNEGIEIDGEDIKNDASISIGGWRYEIDQRFQCERDSKGKVIKKHDSVLYFDGINYWLTSNGIAPQEIVDETQNQPECPLGFESLFPNVVLDNNNQVVIPKMPEPSSPSQDDPSGSDVNPNDSFGPEAEGNGDNGKSWLQKLKDNVSSSWQKLKDRLSLND